MKATEKIKIKLKTKTFNSFKFKNLKLLGYLSKWNYDKVRKLVKRNLNI